MKAAWTVLAADSVGAVDIQNSFPVSHIGLRQNSRMGTIQIDEGDRGEEAAVHILRF